MTAPNPIARLGQPAFLALLQSLLPPGAAWTREPDAVLTGLLAAYADGQARLHARVADWTETESDPAQAIETLSDWEAEYGLPDPCVGLNATVRQRRAALLQKIGTLGGQSRAYYVAVAAGLGYAITITELASARADALRADDPVRDPAYDFAWVVNSPGSAAASYFSADVSYADEPLTTWGQNVLECVLGRLKPAHTYLLFAYVTPPAPSGWDVGAWDRDVWTP